MYDFFTASDFNANTDQVVLEKSKTQMLVSNRVVLYFLDLLRRSLSSQFYGIS